MDFHGLSRKELQTLCKKNKIPANITNVAMADALSALPQVEGLDEFLNPTEAEAGSPETAHPTASRTTTRRKALREEPQSAKVVSSQKPQRNTRGGNGEEGLAEQDNKDASVVPVTPAARRRTTAVSTRRSKKEAEVVEYEEKKVDHGNPTNVTETPAVVPRSRTRATGRSICSKTNGTSAQQGYNTRRSVRFLEKNLSGMSLLDAEDTGLGKSDNVSEEMSISQLIEESADTEDVGDAGISLQTVSNVVLEETDEGEVSSLEKKSESECQVEIDARAEVEAEPQEEDSNLKADSETHEVSNVVHGVSDVDNSNSIEVESAQADNNKAGSELLSESVEASKDAYVEFAEQDVADLIVEVPDDVSVEDTDQNESEASPLPVSPVSYDDSAQLKEVLQVEAEHLNVAENSDIIEVCAESSADKSTSADSITLDLQEELEGKSEHMEESMGEVENTCTSEVTMALESDASSEKSVGAMEAFTESSVDVSNVTILDSHTLVEGDAVSSETLTVVPILELKASAIGVQPDVATETVPKMISDEGNVQNANIKENLATDELHKKSMRELKMMLKKLSLGGKSNCKSKTDNNHNVVKEVERKRTALQALPENQMPQ